jgi:hypothetical protein
VKSLSGIKPVSAILVSNNNSNPTISNIKPINNNLINPNMNDSPLQSLLPLVSLTPVKA